MPLRQPLALARTVSTKTVEEIIMTNWCENLVTISNDDRDVIKAIENAFLRDELLHAFIPCPKELESLTS